MADRALVVDDEKVIVKGLKFSLEQDGMEVDCAYDGEEAVRMANENSYDVILLDVMLPKLSGFDVCKELRETMDVPIIMVTAKGDDMDKILGLEYGADDYITKPFNILEVKARIKAIMRRRNKKAKNVSVGSTEKVYGQMRINKATKRVFIENREVNLTTKEFDLLELLTENPDKIFSREDLLRNVWGHKEDYGTISQSEMRTVDVHVRRLREKIESSPSNPQYIHTKWGVGYYFRA